MYWQPLDRSGSDGIMPQTPPRAAAEITIVTTRTTQTVVHFSAAFELPGLDEALPAGDYRVDHDEESIDGASWLQTLTRIFIPVALPGLIAATIFAHDAKVQKVKAALLFVAYDQMEKATFVREDTTEIWGEVLPRVRKLVDARQKQEYPPKPGFLCRKWCAVTSCPFHGK